MVMWFLGIFEILGLLWLVGNLLIFLFVIWRLWGIDFVFLVIVGGSLWLLFFIGSIFFNFGMLCNFIFLLGSEVFLWVVVGKGWFLWWVFGVGIGSVLSLVGGVCFLVLLLLCGVIFVWVFVICVVCWLCKFMLWLWIILCIIGIGGFMVLFLWCKLVKRISFLLLLLEEGKFFFIIVNGSRWLWVVLVVGNFFWEMCFGFDDFFLILRCMFLLCWVW